MALHDLLDRYVIERAVQPEAFRRVYVHEGHLRRWLRDGPHWRLLAGGSSYRLERLPCGALPERGLPHLRAPLDYACLCWALWFAEVRAADPRRWFVISELAREVARAAEGALSFAVREHREALVRSLQLLVDLGALVHRDGRIEHWVLGEVDLAGGDGGQPAEVLYEFAEDAPRLLAAFDGSGLQALTEPQTEGPALAATGEQAPPLARAWRALLLGPALWQQDDPEAFAALLAEEEAVARELADGLGWELEVAEQTARIWRTTAARGAAGAVLLDLVPDPVREAGDRHVRFIFHPILLLLAAVRAELEGNGLPGGLGPHGALAVDGGRLRDLFVEQFRQHRRNWGSELGEQAGVDEVWQRTCREMRRMGLLRGPDRLGRTWLTPVAAGLAGAYVDAVPAEVEAQPSAQDAVASARSLFDGRPEGPA